VRLTAKQREYVAKYLIDVSKLAFVGIVIGKFVSPNPVPSWVFIVGVIFSILGPLAAVVIDKGDQP
jgi:hypothetical protein